LLICSVPSTAGPLPGTAGEGRPIAVYRREGRKGILRRKNREKFSSIGAIAVVVGGNFT
jgi:hypothetical protein